MTNASDGSQKTVYSNIDAASLIVSDGILAVNGGFKLQVYDTTTGQPLWHVSLPGASSEVMSMKIVNNLLYAILSNNNDTTGEGQSYLVAYQATTGKQVWKSPTFPGDALLRFTVDQNVVYFGTATYSSNQLFTGRVYAYDTQSNKQLWNIPVDGAAQEPFVISNGLVYTVADNGSHKQAHLLAINTTTGTIKWQQSLSGTFLGSFTVSNDVVYASSFSIGNSIAGAPPMPDKLDAFNADNGQKLWEDAQHGTHMIVPTE